MGTAAAGNPQVSVIIPVRDNREGIRQVLACLDAQTLPREHFEVIIGDDGSRPGQIPQVATADGRVRVIACPPLTSYAARNAASAAARGSILAFCDSDCLPEPRWLEEGVAAMAAADIVAGQVIFAAPAPPTIWSLLTADMFLDQERDVSKSGATTSNLLVRRSLFDQLQGFDQSLPSGGDYDFVHRAAVSGARLVYSPRCRLRHPTMDSPRPFLEKIRFTNYWGGVRVGRRGKKETGRAPRFAVPWLIVPFVGVVLARISAARPAIGLDRPRLGASGITPSFRDHLQASILLHFLICYVAGLARFSGWREGRRMASRGLGPVYRLGRAYGTARTGT